MAHVSRIRILRGLPGRWGLLWLALAGPAAHAQIELCNESKSYHYSVALAWWNAEVENWVSRGWFNIKPRQCVKALPAALAGNHVYLYARYLIPSAQRSGNDFVDLMDSILTAGSYGEITGEYGICVQKKAFSLVGNRRCVSRGFDSVQAAEIVLKSGSRGVSIELDDEGRYRFYATR